MGYGKPWTDEEIKNVVNDYKNGMSCSKIAEKYRRSMSGVRKKLIELNEFKSTANHFTEQDIENIIKDYNSGMTYSEIGEKYNRDGSVIIGLLKRKGLYKRKLYYLTDDDILFLKDSYPNESWEYIMKRFEGKGVTRRSIISKMHKLGIRRERYFWNEDDVEILKKYYNYDNTVSDVYEKLGGRYTYNAILRKARVLSLKTREFWSMPEIELMKENYESIGVDGMIRLLDNRSRNSIICMAQKLNLKFAHWKNEEIEYIKNNWNTTSDNEMAKYLSRSERTIRAKREEIGLLRKKSDGKSYEPIAQYIRWNMGAWKSASMKSCNYQCIFTGSPNFDIHHLYGVSNLIRDTFECLGIENKACRTDYSEEELHIIKEKFLELQDKYPLGVCISKPIHTLFHQLYGVGGNTPEQWYEFSENYRKGKYDLLLSKVS